MMSSEKRIEIGTTWPSYHSHSLQSADINANQALQQQTRPALAGLTRQTLISTTARPSEHNFMKGLQPSSNSNDFSQHINVANFSRIRILGTSAEPVHLHDSATGRPRSRLKLLCYSYLNFVSAEIQLSYSLRNHRNQEPLQLPFEEMEE